MTSSIDRPASARWMVLLGVCSAAVVLPLSFSAGAIATPAIGRALGGSPVALNWITNAFMLSFGSCLMAAGALSDQFGRRRVFLAGIAAFALFSLLLTIAPDIVWIDVLRGAQGIAAAGALAGGSAALAQEFDGHAQTRAFSLLGTTFGVGLAFGPVLAGALIEAAGWRAVFASTAVIGVIALLLAAPWMRETRNPSAGRIDWPGIVSFTAMLCLFTVAILEAPARGWSDPAIRALFVAAVFALAAFVAIERRSAHPMLDLSLFRYRRFIGVQMLPIATCYCFVVLLVLLPIRFVGIDGHTPLISGLMMLALCGPMLFVPSLAVWLTRHVSPGVVSAAGLLMSAAALVWLGRLPADATPFAMLAPMAAIGIGAGLPWGLMDGLSVSVVPKERAGMATGIFSTTRVAGEGLALAMVSAALSALVSARLRAALSSLSSLSSLPSLPGIDRDRLAAAAQQLATGDLAGAAARLPGVRAAFLREQYVDAFSLLADGLAIVTVLAALATLHYLRPDPQTATRITNAPVPEAADR
ncbi:MFS transporter [Paraburkholderia graminis]|uniref:MFS family permease n=1 Tax=Paraburkholderia graminis TaxID=60548 RepID=A0ABD5CQM4_9BURK|nr:MFS transporter [Paraburkholderia graminis]MDR6207489.1 MFS family permease [Paraburkholderia graminis]